MSLLFQNCITLWIWIVDIQFTDFCPDFLLAGTLPDKINKKINKGNKLFKKNYFKKEILALVEIQTTVLSDII